MNTTALNGKKQQVKIDKINFMLNLRCTKTLQFFLTTSSIRTGVHSACLSGCYLDDDSEFVNKCDNSELFKIERIARIARIQRIKMTAKYHTNRLAPQWRTVKTRDKSNTK